MGLEQRGQNSLQGTLEVLGRQLVLRLLLLFTVLLFVWEFCMVSVHRGKQNHKISAVIVQGEEGLS